MATENIIETIEKEAMKKDIPAFNVGDTVRVHLVFVEISKASADQPAGSKNIKKATGVKTVTKRQVFEGTVIARKNGSIRETITVRKLSGGVGVEKTFFIHSPKIEKIEVIRYGRVRRAKLYYLRERTGKAATVKPAKNYRKKAAK